MATKTKTGVVRKGRTLTYGTKSGDAIQNKDYGPGEEVQVSPEEYDRLVGRGVLVPPKSEAAEVAKASADTLPANFPGLDALKKADITTYSQLEAVEDRTTIDGIGDKTAGEIDALLEKREG